jgi:hypothetical protein
MWRDMRVIGRSVTRRPGLVIGALLVLAEGLAIPRRSAL